MRPQERISFWADAASIKERLHIHAGNVITAGDMHSHRSASFYAIFAILVVIIQGMQRHQKGVAPILLMHISSTIAVPDSDKR